MQTETEGTPMTTKLTEQLSEKGWIPASVAAQRMNCTVYTVYRRISAKKIEGAQVTGHWFVKEASIKQYEKASSDARGKELLATLK